MPSIQDFLSFVLWGQMQNEKFLMYIWTIVQESYLS